MSLVLIGGFSLFFVVLAALFLRKKRRERIEALTRGSNEADEIHGLQDYVDGKRLPEHTDSEAVKAPKADDLMAAEKAAISAKAEEERAKRERERLEKQAAAAEAERQEAADAEAEAEREREAAEREAQLAAAKKAEEEAAAAREAAEANAKKLRSALQKTRDGFVGRLSKALGGKDIDPSVLDDIEAVLFTADIGARTAETLLESVRKKLKANEFSSADKIIAHLKSEVKAILQKTSERPLEIKGDRPQVFMIVGVNGSGKTTSIGKLAHQLQDEGHKVLLGAGDTFRAAASEQLEIWANRNGCPIVRRDEGADPAAVLFDAVKKAKEDSLDVVLCDTAGRLHTKVNLMEELTKVYRVLGKARDGAPDEVLLVLDGTVGQNAIAQAKQFHEAVPLTGIVLTKLDGTAKGGVVIGIAAELGVPVRYIGVGEGIEDLRVFNPDDFIDAVFGDQESLMAA